MNSPSRTTPAPPGAWSATTLRPCTRPVHKGPPSCAQALASAEKTPSTLWTPTPCRPMGKTRCSPGGISSSVQTTCSLPCGSELDWPGCVTVMHYPLGEWWWLVDELLAVELGHGPGHVEVGVDAVLVHDPVAHAVGQVLDEPARVVVGPVRVVRGGEQG